MLLYVFLNASGSTLWSQTISRTIMFYSTFLQLGMKENTYTYIITVNDYNTSIYKMVSLIWIFKYSL